MGFKLAFVFGFMFVATAGASYMYIKYLQEQNESIENYLDQQANVASQLNSMEAEKNAALREFNTLRDKFSRHDLEDLALNKPVLIQTRVNRGTQRVMDDLVALTDPNQFDEKDEAPDSDNN